MYAAPYVCRDLDSDGNSIGVMLMDDDGNAIASTMTTTMASGWTATAVADFVAGTIAYPAARSVGHFNPRCAA